MALRVMPFPQGIDWQAWVDTVVGFNPSLRNRVSPDLEWREFAQRLTQFESETPREEGFAEWQHWAVAARLALSPD